MLKKTFIIVGIFLIMSILYGLGNQIMAAINSGDRLETSAVELDHLQQENRLLTKQLQQVETIDFIEEQMRNKLNLAKPDETVVIIPEATIEKVLQQQQPKQPEITIPYWQGWLNLFI